MTKKLKWLTGAAALALAIWLYPAAEFIGAYFLAWVTQ